MTLLLHRGHALLLMTQILIQFRWKQWVQESLAMGSCQLQYQRQSEQCTLCNYCINGTTGRLLNKVQFKFLTFFFKYLQICTMLLTQNMRQYSLVQNPALIPIPKYIDKLIQASFSKFIVEQYTIKGNKCESNLIYLCWYSERQMSSERAIIIKQTDVNNQIANTTIDAISLFYSRKCYLLIKLTTTNTITKEMEVSSIKDGLLKMMQQTSAYKLKPISNVARMMIGQIIP